MKAGILHLSDIHIEKADDWICDKAEKIARAVLGTWEPLDAIFVAVSGDIANKGLASQYEIASVFFEAIKHYLENHSNSKVFFIVAPGNHDCDFSEEKTDLKARRAFIDMVIKNPSEIERGDSIYAGVLEVQQHFFNFADNLDTQIKYPARPEVAYQVELDIDSHAFYFNIFNTAWLSQKEEHQGRLVFPMNLVNCDAEKLGKAAFSASVFHHPDNWLDSSNAIEFRSTVEQNSDIILSGHEHHREVFFKNDPETGVSTQTIKADALQERRHPQSSGFNLIIIDLANKKQKLFGFKWRDVEYRVSKEKPWQDFIRNRFLQQQSFLLLPDFEKYLNTLGSLGATGRSRSIRLDDYFLPPRLLIMSFKDALAGKQFNRRIEASSFFDFVSSSKQVVIFGETWQGKTTVAKKVFKELYDRQHATVLADGSKFQSPSAEHFRKVLREEFLNQYDGALWERFLQLPKEKRALVIDNFGQSNLNQRSLQKLLQIASENFEYVIVFAHTDLQLLQYVATEKETAKLSDYTHCEMLPLDASQRTQLIRRWVRFEADTDLEEAELVQYENQLRQLILEAINNGLIASTPFFIFGALQLIESYKTNPNPQFGSVGYIYESVITSRLADLGKNPQQINRTFLVVSLIAHSLYLNDAQEIDAEDLDKVIKSYNINYQQNIYGPSFVREVQKAQILTKQGNGNWKFIGSHLRDFFVAKYFAQALGEVEGPEKEQAKESIQLMIETIVFEPHTRILLFLVFEANNNKQLIQGILNEASLVFGDSQVTDLDTDVKFINDLELSVLDQNLLESGDPRKNQDKKDKADPDDEQSETSLMQNYKKTPIKYSDDLDHFTKTAFALKMIELVGQLVKSFSGTIKKDLKQDLIEECVDIGLRLLHSIFKTHQDYLQELADILKHLIREQDPKLEGRNLENRVDELIILIHHGFAYGIIKKIAQSIGHIDLKPSFNDIFEMKELLSYKLVETAIRLDNYAPSDKKLIDFGSKIKDNKFAYNVLRRLIADYVNYSDVEREQRQRLVDRFKLAGGSEYLLNTAKSERTIHLKRPNTGTFSPPEKKKYLPPEKKN